MALTALTQRIVTRAMPKMFCTGVCGILAILAVAIDSQACSCLPNMALSEAVDQASAVFLGKVESVKASQLRPDQNEVKVIVSRVFKDDIGMVPPTTSSVRPDEVVASTVTVFTSQQESFCGFPFTVGLDYIIFARGNLARLSVSLCSRTTILDGSADVITQLEQLNSGSPSSSSSASAEQTAIAPVSDAAAISSAAAPNTGASKE